ncbi:MULTISPECIES: hypothetical protein [Actinomycetes]|uniref:Membrane-bound hydrophilic protein n=1 Tax=Streptomyces griseorubens TaxID=66897 RepID=A0ABR4SXL4_9ACTN|nr:hypothetical protein [Streptomyces griseorubens]ALV52263.1 hypothetical protein ASR50_24555 [Streptomyces sp. 4F]MBM4828519.1 hypothetical protein [Actinospica acidiphila]MCC9688314.1 hypothetical protein [Streptomyces sp. MNU103]GGQ69636.1 hypothetical protein GCM10010250_47230 [Streptomyces althioticus]GGT28052.1 hypothetical protein GCM10010243_00150 [Streptomyces matensis]
MPADEVTHGADVEASRVRTGPRHAAPKKPLFTRFHMPAGKAIAIAAMPTAVLMGMGFTPTLAQADDQPSSRNLTADEFKECLEAIEKADKGDASASPTPSATASESASEDDKEPSADPTGSAPAEEAPEKDAGKGSDSSPDSGSDDKAEPAPTPSATAGAQAADTEPAPSPSETDKNLLEQIGDAIKDVFTPGGKAEETPSPSPSASASSSAPAEEKTDEKDEEASQKPAEKAAGDVLDKVGDAAQDATEKAEEAAEEETKEPEATASPSPSESSGIDLEDCPVATDAEGGVDNNVPLPDDPWYLNASSLLLKGADYKGIVEVRTANGTKKKVLKYVISDGTDIGDLHQTVKDKQSGKTYHVQAAKGSTSTIRDGDTVMYTESISGNLLGLIPITFDPENPPPLNIPLIYFTKVTVQQAGQFGGTLHVPGLHQYVTD